MQSLLACPDRASRSANTRMSAPSKEQPTSRACTRLKSKRPSSMPLYWKCIESTMRRPGWRKREAAITRVVKSAGLMYLCMKQIEEKAYVRWCRMCKLAGWLVDEDDLTHGEQQGGQAPRRGQRCAGIQRLASSRWALSISL